MHMYYFFPQCSPLILYSSNEKKLCTHQALSLSLVTCSFNYFVMMRKCFILDMIFMPSLLQHLFITDKIFFQRLSREWLSKEHSPTCSSQCSQLSSSAHARCPSKINKQKNMGAASWNSCTRTLVLETTSSSGN